MSEVCALWETFGRHGIQILKRTGGGRERERERETEAETETEGKKEKDQEVGSRPCLTTLSLQINLYNVLLDKKKGK